MTNSKEILTNILSENPEKIVESIYRAIDSECMGIVEDTRLEVSKNLLVENDLSKLKQKAIDAHNELENHIKHGKKEKILNDFSELNNSHPDAESWKARHANLDKHADTHFDNWHNAKMNSRNIKESEEILNEVNMSKNGKMLLLYNKEKNLKRHHDLHLGTGLIEKDHNGNYKINKKHKNYSSWKKEKDEIITHYEKVLHKPYNPSDRPYNKKLSESEEIYENDTHQHKEGIKYSGGTNMLQADVYDAKLKLKDHHNFGKETGVINSNGKEDEDHWLHHSWSKTNKKIKNAINFFAEKHKESAKRDEEKHHYNQAYGHWKL